MARKAIWIDRDLVRSPIYIALCVTERQFQRELERLNLDRDRWPAFIKCGADATVHFFTCDDADDGKNAAIVCISQKADRDDLQVYAMLVHEAVHIWQEICEDIREDDPSSEFEAYSIQALSQRLMYAYRELTEKKAKRKGEKRK